MVSAKRANPSVPILVIINPCSGPGESQVTGIADCVQELRTAKLEVVGYVPTGFGKVPARTVESWISEYHSWYGVDGIFFDEVSNEHGQESRYSSLRDFAELLGMKLSIGNPGVPVLDSFSGVFDICVVAEGPHLVPPSTFSAISRGAPSGSVAAIMYSVHALNQAYVDMFLDYFGYIYATERGTPDPYASLSGYFGNLASMVAKACGDHSSGIGMVTVMTVDSNGVPIVGLRTSVRRESTVLADGPSPLTFRLSSGESYEVTVDQNGNADFDHWSSGETSNSITIAPGKSRVLTAYFRSK